MKNNNNIKVGSAKFLLKNISTIVTIITALLALILSQLNLISDKILPSIIIGLLALIAISQLIDNRRTLSSFVEKIQILANKVDNLDNTSIIQRFPNSESAIYYLANRTKSARFSVDQASIDKQRARKTSVRFNYEKERSDLILSDRVKYRYIGIIDDQRRFRSVLKLMAQGPLNNFFVAFQDKPKIGIPMLNFTIFDKEEIVTRAPYSIGEDPVYISIKSKEITELFLGYFEKLWNNEKKADNIDDVRNMLSDYKKRKNHITNGSS